MEATTATSDSERKGSIKHVDERNEEPKLVLKNTEQTPAITGITGISSRVALTQTSLLTKHGWWTLSCLHPDLRPETDKYTLDQVYKDKCDKCESGSVLKVIPIYSNVHLHSSPRYLWGSTPTQQLFHASLLMEPKPCKVMSAWIPG